MLGSGLAAEGAVTLLAILVLASLEATIWETGVLWLIPIALCWLILKLASSFNGVVKVVDLLLITGFNGAGASVFAFTTPATPTPKEPALVAPDKAGAIALPVVIAASLIESTPYPNPFPIDCNLSPAPAPCIYLTNDPALA